ncbi:MAG: hypothetical protein VST70_06735 [Nitrospirota bacterium]|nr:hypothetical protein [Nitrospirota bacterium]
MRLLFRSPFPSSFRNAGFFPFSLLALCLLVSCSLPLKPAPPPPSPPHAAHKKPSMESLNRLHFLQALSQKHYREALEIAKRIHNPTERESFVLLAEREWNYTRGELLNDLFDKEDYAGAYEEILKIRTLSVRDYTNSLLVLKPLVLSRFFRHAIHVNNEKYAIQTMNQLQPFKKYSFRPLVAGAYAHWSLRRYHQGRYFDAILLARQSLSADSKNKLAQTVISRVGVLNDRIISKGLIAYRHQKIHSAIQYWNKSLKIDPSNEKVKKYILEAQGILNKIRTLKNQDGPHTPPT